jgi:uncharacterized RDD family membrane protein YckC
MFCRKCGKEIDPTSKFCSFCGESVNNIVQKDISETVQEKIKTEVTTENLQPTTQGKRFLNILMDMLGYYIFSFSIGFIFGILGLGDLITSTDDTVLGAVFLILYYLIFEGIWGKTPAKLLTKTKVITNEGNKPSFGTIVIRTLCRYIPFDALSFLSSNPVGWHDSLSNTLVVDEV